MKKTIKLLALFLLAFFLVSCGSETEEIRTFETEQGGVLTTLVYTAKGDIVTKQTTKNVIDYEATGLLTKEAAQAALGSLIQQFQGVVGITHSIEYGDFQAIENMTVDYELVDFDEIKNLPGMNFDEGVKENGISMKHSSELLKEVGFSEVK